MAARLAIEKTGAKMCFVYALIQRCQVIESTRNRLLGFAMLPVNVIKHFCLHSFKFKIVPALPIGRCYSKCISTIYALSSGIFKTVAY